MSDKWLRFKSFHSPAKIAINTGRADILLDWQRLNWDNTFIDGHSLAEIMKPLSIEQGTLTPDQLTDFFSDVILKKYTYNKENVIQILLKSFHQGGLLHPVSAAMSHVFENEGFGPSSRASENTRQVNIKTSDKGFTVQEIYTIKKCTLKPHASQALQNMYPESVIDPDCTEEYVIQAQATIDISFENKDPNTTAHLSDVNNTIISNTISYGSQYVKSIADKRSWLDKLVDFLRNLLSKIKLLDNKFHPNSVKNLSMLEEEKEEKIGARIGATP